MPKSSLTAKLATLIAAGAMALAGLAVAELPASAAAPANDNWSAAVALTLGSPVTGTTVGATAEAGEPSLFDDGPYASVWYRYTPASSGLVRISTEGSDYDTTLGVYTGSSVSALTEVATNDDSPDATCSDAACNDLWSSLAFAATGGTTYYVVVDGYDGDTGSFDLAVTPVTGNAITGTVRGPGGTPLRGVQVEAYRSTEDDDEYGSATTAADGSYVITGLGAGTYGVYAYHGDNNVVSATYGDPVTVSDDAVSTGIDFSLVAGGIVSGVVTSAAGGGALEDVCVDADGDDAYGSAVTDATGHYSVVGLATGDYDLWFYDCGDNNVLTARYPSSVSVTQGSTTSGIDIALQAGGIVTGTVSFANGIPAEDLCVYAGQAETDDGEEYFSAYAGAWTGADGTYRIDGLASGSYVIMFADCAEEYGDDEFLEYYDDATSLDDATPVSVTAGQTVSGIDAQVVVDNPATTESTSSASASATASSTATTTATTTATSTPSSSSTSGGGSTTTPPSAACVGAKSALAAAQGSVSSAQAAVTKLQKKVKKLKKAHSKKKLKKAKKQLAKAVAALKKAKAAQASAAGGVTAACRVKP
ncbi:MAG: carboxypeptidase-like regulatory domain-containing protein [Nocardioides sp.]|uniref:carboxypeptidase regulatory-like domain-containing protein n=1 Tax=Nocardioides sp. TaxID=35761 RepID=UPI0039E3D6C2